MGIFGIFKRFQKKDDIIISSELVKLRNSIYIRTRDELDAYDESRLDKYKKIYSDKLRKRILFSGDLDTNDFKKEMDMYIELLSNLFLKENSIFEGIDDYNEKLNLMIKIKKKDLYLQNIIDIIKELELRIIALEEILEEDISLSVRKKRAIVDKIESLVVLLSVFRTQGQAVYLDANANIKTVEILEEDTDFLYDSSNKKRDLLERMFTIMMPNKVPYYRCEEFKSIYDEIAYLERELEIGVYEHKDVIKYIEEYLDRYDLENGTIQDFEELELRIRVFSDFGRKLVSDELLEKLYRIKFSIITRDITHSYKKEMFENLSFIELEQYQALIFEKISDILNGNHKHLRILFGDTYGNVKLIVKVLKDGKNEYDWYKILTSKFLLSFLLALESERGIFEFFRFTKDERVKYGNKDDFEEQIFTWEDELPLETIFDVLDDSNLPLAKLYRKLFIPIRERFPSSSVTYQIPEGIVSIDCKDKKTSSFLEYIRTLSEGKIVFTPSSLKRINGDIFGGRQFKFLNLNEGLEELLNFPASDYPGLNSFCIPSTLIKVANTTWKNDEIQNADLERLYIGSHYLTGPIYDNVKDLTFRNFDFNNPSEATKFIINIFFSVTYDQYFGKDAVNLSNDLPNSPYNIKRVGTSLESITFEGINGERVEIKGSDLSNLVAIRNILYLSRGLFIEEIEELFRYILEEKLAKSSSDEKRLIY